MNVQHWLRPRCASLPLKCPQRPSAAPAPPSLLQGTMKVCTILFILPCRQPWAEVHIEPMYSCLVKALEKLFQAADQPLGTSSSSHCRSLSGDESSCSKTVLQLQSLEFWQTLADPAAAGFCEHGFL